MYTTEEIEVATLAALLQEKNSGISAKDAVAKAREMLEEAARLIRNDPHSRL